MEPFNLKRWEVHTSRGDACFYTCARPGRSKGQKGRVSDQIVSAWVSSLPGPDTAIVSLLGRKRKKTGSSEFSYYTFSGGFDTCSERQSQPTFREWLDIHHAQLKILVREHPTYDYRPIPHENLTAIEVEVRCLILMGRTVVVVDSVGIRAQERCADT